MILKRISAFAIILLLTLSALCVSISAETQTAGIGDTNRDGTITLADAMTLFRIVAKLQDADAVSIAEGDINEDGSITLADAMAVFKSVSYGSGSDHLHIFTLEKNPSPSQDGYCHIETCKTCKLTANTTEHTFKRTAFFPATLDDAGTEWITCEDCGIVISRQTAKALPILVNYNHPIPDDIKLELTDAGNGMQIAKSAAPHLKEMMNACTEAGYPCKVRQGYRTNKQQQTLYNNKVNAYISDGYSEAKAKEKAAESVAVPGTSEHEIGLAVDINSTNGKATSMYAWLKKHCAEYGFIMRYPDDKTSITKIKYEPWHYRYVGITAAKEIMSKGITLEEYLANK